MAMTPWQALQMRSSLRATAAEQHRAALVGHSDVEDQSQESGTIGLHGKMCSGGELAWVHLRRLPP
jgi:hypothetical protein